MMLVLHRIGDFDGLEITRISANRFELLLELIGEAANNNIALSFDDGDRSIIEVAYPMMKQRGRAGQVFVCPQWVGHTGRWGGNPIGHPQPMMDWDDLRQLSRDGWEIGSHGMTHRDLTAMSDRALTSELTESAETIATEIGVRPKSVAYPYGRFDDRVVAAAESAGYQCGYATTSHAGNTGSFRSGRIPVYATDTINAWRRLMSGSGNGGLWRNHVFGSLAAGSAAWQNLLALMRPAA